MVKHLAYNAFDMSGINTAVNRYKTSGLRADYEVDAQAVGIVRIMLENPVRRDGSIVCFEVHKTAKPGWLGDKAWWVVQLWSAGSEEEGLTKRGCIVGRTQAIALSDAEWDVQFGFVSVLSFAQAVT